MGEKVINPIEKSEVKPEHIEIHVNHQEHLSKTEKHHAGEKQKHIEHKARQTAEKLALKTSEQASKKETVHEESHDEIVLSKSYKSIMHRVETQLPSYQKAFSKFIRNPSIEKTSFIVGNTIARPSAIIGGAAFAFFGLAIFGLIAKNVGFELPNSLFVVLVIVGWFTGLISEFIFRTYRRLF